VTTVRNVWAIFLRELGGFFLSPVAYVVIFLFLVTNGAMFSNYALVPTPAPRQITGIVEALFGFDLIWVLFLSPLLTMRLFAEEKRSGTFEVLLTAPVTEWQVVLGKFLGAQAFYMLIWLGLAPLFAILAVLGKPDWGPIAAMYAGLFALGLLTNALGILASAVTRNQLVAAILALTGNLFFYLLYLGAFFFPAQPEARRVVQYLSFTSHFGGDFFQGVVDLRHVFFYASWALLFLFFSVRVVEARK
jgi:ABC-2 type transport system permease protein